MSSAVKTPRVRTSPIGFLDASRPVFVRIKSVLLVHAASHLDLFASMHFN